jgi:hypothetical protein
VLSSLAKVETMIEMILVAQTAQMQRHAAFYADKLKEHVSHADKSISERTDERALKMFRIVYDEAEWAEPRKERRKGGKAQFVRLFAMDKQSAGDLAGTWEFPREF